MNQQEVLNEIIEYYLSSRDFNGLSIDSMKLCNNEVLCKLIDDELIQAISDKDVINPHIRVFDFKIPKNHQKKNIANKNSHVVLYPTQKALLTIDTDKTYPYKSMMQKGEYQFKIVYFDLAILEIYANNPKYFIYDFGYRGNIYTKDNFDDDFDNNEYEYIKDYGIATIKNSSKKAIGVFVTDLSKLTMKQQMLWKSFEIKDQNSCTINPGFIKNLILGEWVNQVWIFHALLEEMIVINNQCEAIGIPQLFKKTFESDPYSVPDGYRNILLPTLKNYHDFILVLEKIIVSNINFKTFIQRTSIIKAIDRKNDKGVNKGTLVMLEEWLKLNIYTDQNLSENIIIPLKKIRNLRQKPAHDLVANIYDVQLYKEQKKLMHITYSAIRTIRLLFSNHPLAKNINIPEYLFKGENIVNY